MDEETANLGRNYFEREVLPVVGRQSRAQLVGAR